MTVMLKSVTSTEDPELASRFDRVLSETVEALEGSGIHYVFIGGIASGGLGRPRSTFDIDVFVRPEEAELALRALAKKGFETEKTDPVWLYKGYKEDILVDVIFKSKGEIYLDSEMYNRILTAEFRGKKLKLVAPEDLIIIKAVAHSELTPGHWHDALALLSHASIDWDYLIRRARKAPRRVLSLLLYAQSSDIWVPNQVIHELFSDLFGEQPRGNSAHYKEIARKGGPYAFAQSGGAPRTESVEAAPHAHVMKAEYMTAHLREILAEDSRTHELDIEVVHFDGRILLKGEVRSADRRELVERIARESFPDVPIENQIRVSDLSVPGEPEVIK